MALTLKEKIQALLTAANTATEAGDDDLTSAVATLIAGYNPGGSGTPADDLSDIIGAVTGSTDRAKIAALIAAANEATDEEDDTLKEAFDSLIAGYGQGGGSGGATWAEITVMTDYDNMLECSHGLVDSVPNITYPAYFRYRGEQELRKFKAMLVGSAPASASDSNFAVIGRYKSNTGTALEFRSTAQANEVHLSVGDIVEATFDDIF